MTDLRCPFCGYFDSAEAVSGSEHQCDHCGTVFPVPENFAPTLQPASMISNAPPKPVPASLPQNPDLTPVVSAVAVLLFAVGSVWFLFGGGLEQQTRKSVQNLREQVADDLVQQYEIAKRSEAKRQRDGRIRSCRNRCRCLSPSQGRTQL